MTLRELFAVPPVKVSHALGYLAGYHNHMEYADSGVFAGREDANVEIRILAEIDFDHHRYWRLATVWFKGEPVMAIQNAGQSGADHHEKFVADVDRYRALDMYLRATYPSSDYERDDYPMDEDIVDLDIFCGYSLAQMQAWTTPE